jgi:hypothetical protein
MDTPPDLWLAVAVIRYVVRRGAARPLSGGSRARAA